MKKVLFIYGFIICATTKIIAQDQPIYNQFYFNPYLYNPAYLTEEGLEFNVTYRRQWADVADAPQVGALNVQYAGRKKFAFGFSLQTQSSVVLNTNIAHVTIGYKIPFGLNNQLRFGLSVGVLQNTLDLDELARTSDPSILEDIAILNAIDKSYYFSSQFGVNYQYKTLSIGLAFPKLFDNRFNTPEKMNNPSFDQLQNFILSGSNEFSINTDISLTPLVLFRYVNEVQYQAELSGIVKYKEFVSLGAGYRYESGVIGYFGLKLNKQINFSYSYEAGGINSSSFNGATHEMHLKFKIKRKDKANGNEPVQEETLWSNIKNKESETSQEEGEVGENDSLTFTVENSPEVEQSGEANSVNDIERERITDQASEITGIAPGYYIVVGAFLNKENATNLSNLIAKVDMKSYIVYNKDKELYYVHLLKTPSKADANALYYFARNLPYYDFKDAWILHIE